MVAAPIIAAKAAGDTHKIYSGVTHEFYGMDAVVAKAKEAQDFAVSSLEKGFNNGIPGTVATGEGKQ
jgi:acetyl esterase